MTHLEDAGRSSPTTTEAKRKAFAESLVAAAVSGTVTLELALAGVPMAITYVGDRGQMKRWRKYKPRFVGAAQHPARQRAWCPSSSARRRSPSR